MTTFTNNQGVQLILTDEQLEIIMSFENKEAAMEAGIYCQYLPDWSWH